MPSQRGCICSIPGAASGGCRRNRILPPRLGKIATGAGIVGRCDRNLPRTDRFGCQHPDVLRLNHITFACADPGRVAEFWAALLDGYTVNENFARGDGPELFFRKAEKSQTIELPIHLDVNV